MIVSSDFETKLRCSRAALMAIDLSFCPEARGVFTIRPDLNMGEAQVLGPHAMELREILGC